MTLQYDTLPDCRMGLARGDRVLLVFLPSLDFIVAFIGCLRAGVIPVPVYPPDPRRARAHVSAFASIAANSGAKHVLTHAPYDRVVSASALKDAAMRLFSVFRLGSKDGPVQAMTWPDIPWSRLEVLTRGNAASSIPDGGASMPATSGASPTTTSLAFLQYTSGSTGAPKGVMISHGNLAHNLATIVRSLDAGPDTVVASWLPQYHDMGLIGSYLGVVYCGGSGVYMSPVSFIRRPATWVEAAAKYAATHLQSPNFGFRLAARKWRESHGDASVASRARVDLSHVRHMFNAAEPVTVAATREFLSVFGAYGLRPAAMHPGYGLAEHTVYVSDGADALVLRVDRAGLEGELVGGDLEAASAGSGNATGGRVAIVSSEPLCAMASASTSSGSTVELVTLGPVAPHHASGRNADIIVLIVNATTRCVVPDGELGEVWISSPSVAQGYWGLPELTETTFGAQLADTGVELLAATPLTTTVPSPSPSDHQPRPVLPLQGQSATMLEIVSVVVDDATTTAHCDAGAAPSQSRGLHRPDLHARYATTRFLRTGDVGAIVDGLLVLAGRGKDMLIVRGKNYFPADAEASLERADPVRVRPGCTAVFQARLPSDPKVATTTESAMATSSATDANAATPPTVTVTVTASPALLGDRNGDDDSGAVAAVEVRDSELPVDPVARTAALEALSAVLRTAVLRDVGLRLDAVLLLRPHGIVKTTSGKVARRWNARAWESMIEVTVGRSGAAAASRPPAAQGKPLQQQQQQQQRVEPSPWGTIISPNSATVLHLWCPASREVSLLDDTEDEPAQHTTEREISLTDVPLEPSSGKFASGSGALLVGAELLAALRREVALLLREPDADTVDVSVSLQDLGLDSLSLTQFNGALALEYGIMLPEGELFAEGVTLEWLVEAAPAARRLRPPIATPSTLGAAIGTDAAEGPSPSGAKDEPVAREGTTLSEELPAGGALQGSAVVRADRAISSQGENTPSEGGVEVVGLPPRRPKSGGPSKQRKQASWMESNCPCLSWCCCCE